MIPKKIHYCWFGNGEMPELYKKCIESWHEFMPDYEYVFWNESNFNINSFQYAKEAYDSRKYAFVSDVARLYALYKEGGIYLDVDFKVFKPFDDLLDYKAFAGFEGSKHFPIMMGVIASEANGEWVREQLERYADRHFIINGRYDLTTNVKFVSDHMHNQGFIPNGIEQDLGSIHIFPVDYFCPRQTTGEYFKTDNSYCEQIESDSSWAKNSIKSSLLSIFHPSTRTKLIKIKRKLFG